MANIAASLAVDNEKGGSRVNCRQAYHTSLYTSQVSQDLARSVPSIKCRRVVVSFLQKENVSWAAEHADQPMKPMRHCHCFFYSLPLSFCPTVWRLPAERASANVIYVYILRRGGGIFESEI